MGLGGDDYNNINNVNANNNFNNNGRARGIASLKLGTFCSMKTYKKLYHKLVSIENLQDAYWKARTGKSNNPVVREFEKHWQLRLAVLHRELKTRTYAPRPLKTFILRDPKTRRICVSDFRDRIVHHALVNVLQPIFEPRFIHDSYASRKGKGTLVALKRFDAFLRKVAHNCAQPSNNVNAFHGFAFKADIKHYFDTVDHNVLLSIISKRVKDDGVLWLVKTILEHHNSGVLGKGMPLGNWTSQFFANVYLNELDQFVKHKLKAKYYIRYVDDFVILNQSRMTLQEQWHRIVEFLNLLKLKLHPTKCQLIPASRGVSLLGFRAFHHYKLPRKINLRKIHNRINELLTQYELKDIDANAVLTTLQGWNAYAMNGNTYKLRERLTKMVEQELMKRKQES